MLFASLILAPFAFHERKDAQPMDRRTIGSVALTGVILAVHFFAFISSLRYTSVASSTLLVNFHPLIVGAASVLILKESSKRTIIGVTIGFVGVAIIALTGLGTGESLGNALALLGGVMAALYIIAGRVLRRTLGIFTYAFCVYLTAAAVLLSSAVINGVPLWPYPTEELLIFLALAVVCTIFGHTVYNWSLKYLTAPVISTSLLGNRYWPACSLWASVRGPPVDGRNGRAIGADRDTSCRLGPSLGQARPRSIGSGPSSSSAIIR